MKVHSSFICESKTRKQLRCPSTGEWINTLWFIIQWNGLLTQATTWMNIKMFVLSERSQTKRSTHHMIPFILNYTKCKPIYGDRKQISSCQRQRRAGGKHYKRAGGHFFWWWIYSLTWLRLAVHRRIHMSKLTKLYFLNRCSLFYVNYTLIELFKKKKRCKAYFIQGLLCEIP